MRAGFGRYLHKMEETPGGESDQLVTERSNAREVLQVQHLDSVPKCVGHRIPERDGTRCGLRHGGAAHR